MVEELKFDTNIKSTKDKTAVDYLDDFEDLNRPLTTQEQKDVENAKVPRM